MSHEIKKLSYTDSQTQLISQLFSPHLTTNEHGQTKFPAIVLAPTWAGIDDFILQKGRDLSDLGFIVLVADLYGEGYQSTNNQENAEKMNALLNNRFLIRRRMNLALERLKLEVSVDSDRTAAIGFCLGGLAVLDLARSGADINAVISFHGLLDNPLIDENTTIRSSILILHGHDDPMVPPDQILSFQQEMTAADTDWQMHIHGGAQHAFTNPMANEPQTGKSYHWQADKRSWRAMKQFLAEKV